MNRRLYGIIIAMVGFAFAANANAASSATQTQTVGDCTITYQLFGSGLQAIAPANVQCNSDHQIEVSIQLYGSSEYTAYDSNYGLSAGAGANGPASSSCDPGTQTCSVNANANYQVTIDGYTTGTSLQISA